MMYENKVMRKECRRLSASQEPLIWQYSVRLMRLMRQHSKPFYHYEPRCIVKVRSSCQTPGAIYIQLTAAYVECGIRCVRDLLSARHSRLLIKSFVRHVHQALLGCQKIVSIHTHLSTAPFAKQLCKFSLLATLGAYIMYTPFGH